MFEGGQFLEFLYDEIGLWADQSGMQAVRNFSKPLPLSKQKQFELSGYVGFPFDFKKGLIYYQPSVGAELGIALIDHSLASKHSSSFQKLLFGYHLVESPSRQPANFEDLLKLVSRYPQRPDCHNGEFVYDQTKDQVKVSAWWNLPLNGGLGIGTTSQWGNNTLQTVEGLAACSQIVEQGFALIEHLIR